MRSRTGSTRHGHARRGATSKEYRSWDSMIQRCTNVDNPEWHNYGGRGISVCARWLHSFDNFLSDLGPKPTPRHTLDRIDNDGSYEPTNVRWATHAEQMLNLRKTVFATIGGIRKPAATWAREAGISARTIRSRMQRGYSAEDAIKRGPMPRLSPDQLSTIRARIAAGIRDGAIAAEIGVSRQRVNDVRRGWTWTSGQDVPARELIEA